MHLRILAMVVFVYFVPAALAEESTIPVSLSDTSRHTLFSETLNQSFQIDVALPPQPVAAMASTYPVIYLVDGNGMFPLVYASTRSLQRGNELQPVIVVGIGFPSSDFFEVGLLRTEYLTPTANKAFEDQMNNSGMPLKSAVKTGSANKLVSFIAQELKPFINATYPVDTNNEIFAGYSFGGLFGTYVLFNHTGLFDKYVLGSPSLWWDDGKSFVFEENYARENKDLPATVFMSSGTADMEMMITGARTMQKTLAGRGYEGLLLEYLEFEGETHSSGIGVALNRGIKSVSVTKGKLPDASGDGSM